MTLAMVVVMGVLPFLSYRQHREWFWVKEVIY